jgi:hypothetical protein
MLGCWTFADGVTLCQGSRRKELRALAIYYCADLLHNWGSYFLLLGPRWRRVFRPWFAGVRSMYAWVERTADGRELMSYDYYWMRQLEARLISASSLSSNEISNIEGKLQEIEHRNRLVQDHVQRGNTYAYRALLAYYAPVPNLEQSKAFLADAERTWARGGGTVASGRRRVALFRRVIGELTFRQAVKLLIG